MHDNDTFVDVAGVLTSVFHDLDLVPSDIAAGLLLMHLRHKKDREEKRRSLPIQSDNQVVVRSENVLTSRTTCDPWGRAEFSPTAVSVPLSIASSSPEGHAQYLGNVA